MILYRCPACFSECAAPEAAAGTALRCGTCGQAVLVPDPNQPVPALPLHQPPTRIVFGGEGDAEWKFMQKAFGVLGLVIILGPIVLGILSLIIKGKL